MSKAIYTPIIKGKKNDMLALMGQEASVLGLMKPLLELPPTPSKESTDSYLEKFISRCGEFANIGNSFVDFYGFLPGEKSKSGKLAVIRGYELLHQEGIHVTPVYGFGRDHSAWELLKKIVKEHASGFCFRLDIEDIEEDVAEATWDQIASRASELALLPAEIDLVIDLGDVRIKDIETLAAIVTTFMSFKSPELKFRSIAVAGSSAPKDVTVVAMDSIGEISRNELMLWAKLKLDLAVGEELVYSDYGVVHPDFAADNLPVGGTANCKIRYTAGKSIHIFRGHKRAGDSGQPFKLAKMVRDHEIYCGREFSDGDQYIDDVANKDDGPGNLGNWVHADMSHHLKYATVQVAALNEKLHDAVSDEELAELLEFAET